jgi:prepilin-type N-terminal cleavage/methylation domain-containing protein
MRMLIKINKRTKAKANENGFTLVEILFTMVIMSIIALGTAQYMVYSRWDIDRGIRKQLAWMNMASRMEEAVDYGYTTVAASLPETSKSILLNGVQAYRTTTVEPVDDGLDGYWPSDASQPDYYKIQIYISWFTTDNHSDTLTAYLSEGTSWSY